MPDRPGQAGYALAGLLVAIAVMGVMMSMLLPVWSQAAQREREAELIFRGEQYSRAIELFQRRYVGTYPDDLDTLVEQRFLRRLYPDPMSGDGEFRPVYESQLADLVGEAATADRPGERPESDDERPPARRRDRMTAPQGGIVGVVSTSEEESIRLYNGSRKYNEWAFVYAPTSTDAGGVATGGAAAGAARPAGTVGRAPGEDRGRFRSGGRGAPLGREGRP